MKHLSLTLLAILVYFTSTATVGPINGTTTICVGTTTSLTDTSGGGTWSGGGAIAAVGSITGIVTGISAGTATITYTTGTGSATTVVTVNPLPSVIVGSLSICTGSVTTLSDLTVGGTWSASNGNATVGSSSGLVTGLVAGTDVITYALLTGCMTTVVATVNAIPPPITGPTSICGTATISDAAPGGVWSCSNPAIATIGMATGIVTGVSSGTVVITYTIPTGCMTALVVTVNPGAGPILGPLGACTGMTTSLTDATGGGTWSSSNTAVGTISAAGTVTGISAGTTVISYTVPSGCGPAMAIITVNLSPAMYTGPSYVCLGNTITLSDVTPGGVWSSSNTSVAIINAAGVVTPIAPGATVIQYTIASCFAGGTITVNPATAFSSPGTVCVGSNITISSSIGGGTWSSGTPAIASVGSATGMVNGVSNGIAIISYTYLSSCIATDTIDVGTVLGVVTNSPSVTCTAPDFYVSTCGVSSTYNVTSYFGDGTSSNIPLSSTSICHADVIHAYSFPGTYTVKQVLYSGTTAMDSNSFTYNYFYCRYLPLKFYFDANTNCVMDAGEHYNTAAIRVAVDSNGISIDTVSATSGLYYEVYGPPGTVYGFRVVSPYLSASCPADSVIYDTIQSVINDYPIKYCGLYCNGTSGYDLAITSTLLTGRHQANGTIIVNNNYCNVASAVVTATYSPKYVYGYSSPIPASHAGNTITWNLGPLSVGSGSRFLTFHVDVPGAWLIPGDTIHSSYIVTPTTGDIDTINNNCVILDTVNGAWDPNEMSVSPSGYVSSGTKLQYSINFENTGNDTAFNISVYDTLSDNVDIHSLNIVAASATMNITTLNDGTHNIVKFDFPNINLLDSSHHGLCDGMVVFTINTKTGLPQCTPVYNEAGIYFDYNAVVMTNKVENIIGTQPDAGQITGPDTVCVGQVVILADTVTGGTWNASNGNAYVYGAEIMGATPGLDTIYYNITNACGTTASTNAVVYVLPTSACSTTGINTMPANAAITIFPNPAGNEIIITAPEAIKTLTITNLLGQTMYSQQPNAERTQADVSGLQPGIYFVKVNNTAVRKFVKE